MRCWSPYKSPSGDSPTSRHPAYYKKCPRCGTEYHTEQEYREKTKKTLFTTVSFGICRCGYDLEKDQNAKKSG